MSSAKKYTNDELLGIRNCQLEIYDAIAKICEKHSIRYTAVAGTVLGAVRHNGYIPWDDDFDIAMPRKDYEKFIEKAKDELDDRFFLQNYETEPTCINYFTKVRRNGTLFVQESDVSVNMHKGIFVDIFPLDNLPKASFMRKFFRFRQVIIYQFYIAKTTKGTMGDSKSFKGKIRRLTRGVLHVITVLFSKKKLYKSLDKLLKNTTQILRDCLCNLLNLQVMGLLCRKIS